MAVTTEGIDKATISRCEVVDGAFIRTLPWQFVEFADASEAGIRYWMPANQGLHHVSSEPYRMKREAMRSSPWPHEVDAGPRSTTTADDQSKPGPLAVNYLGFV